MQAIDQQGTLLEAANSNEWDSVPLKAYPLQDFTYRRSFLFQVYWRGEDCLFEAVAHVWNSLKPPQDYRSAVILDAAGFGGSGKAALMGMLKIFITEGVATISAIPPPAGFGNLEEWNEAISEAASRDDTALGETLEKWTYFLNGQKPPRVASSSNGASNARYAQGDVTEIAPSRSF